MLNPALVMDSPERGNSWQIPRLALAGGSDVPPGHGDAQAARGAEIIDLADARRTRQTLEA
jgi:hypothetical protein